jgi:DNA-binding Lrp family transcriptional regulator
MQAYILIRTHIGDIYPALGILRRTSGIISAYATFGPYDIVALVEAEDIDQLSNLVAKKIHGISEILETTTCVLLGQQSEDD